MLFGTADCSFVYTRRAWRVSRRVDRRAILDVKL